MIKKFISILLATSMMYGYVQAQSEKEHKCVVGCNASYCEMSAKIVAYDSENMLLTIAFDCNDCSGKHPVFVGIFIKERQYESTCRYNFIVDVGRDPVTRKSTSTFSVYGCGVSKYSHTVSDFTIEEMSAVRMSGSIFYKNSEVELKVQ